MQGCGWGLLSSLILAENNKWSRNIMNWLNLDANAVACRLSGLESKRSRTKPKITYSIPTLSNESLLWRSPIVGQNGHPMLTNFQWWSNLYRFITSVKFSKLLSPIMMNISWSEHSNYGVYTKNVERSVKRYSTVIYYII